MAILLGLMLPMRCFLLVEGVYQGTRRDKVQPGAVSDSLAAPAERIAGAFETASTKKGPLASGYFQPPLIDNRCLLAVCDPKP